jgi:hypothetical protein
MAGIRLRPGETCQECGGQTGLPHFTSQDCVRCLSEEETKTLTRVHQIAEDRRKLLVKRLERQNRALKATDLGRPHRKVRKVRYSSAVGSVFRRRESP